jgi:hypothetical protein
MPFLNDEVKEWIAMELQSLGVEDLAVYALEAGTEGDERRVMVATEVGLLDHRYAPLPPGDADVSVAGPARRRATRRHVPPVGA